MSSRLSRHYGARLLDDSTSSIHMNPSNLSHVHRKFFGVPNGTKPAKTQQSKLAFSSKSHQPPEEEGTETAAQKERKPVENTLQNGAVKIEDQDDDAQMTNDQETDSSQNSESMTKKESRNLDPQKSRKRASDDFKAEQDGSSEDEPPSKKQKRKSQPDGSKNKSCEAPISKVSKPLKAADVREEIPVKKSAFAAITNDRRSGDADRSTSKGETESTKKGGKKTKQEPESLYDGETKSTKVKSKKGAEDEISSADEGVESAQEEDGESEDEKPEVAAKVREKVQSTLKTTSKDPYPDWQPGEPVPYAALCTTFSKIEMTSKRLEILAHCSLFLRQVLRLTPKDLLPTVQLMIGKLAADYAGIELGIGESLIMKAIGESTGRSLSIIKSDQKAIGDLGLVAAKSRSNQPTMSRPKPLTVRGVHEGLMAIAVIEGQGAQGRKVAGIKKLLSAADQEMAGKGLKGVDINKDKGGPSESKFIVRLLEGKMRLGLADKTILNAVAQAVTVHEISQGGNKVPTTDQMAKSESILKSVYK